MYLPIVNLEDMRKKIYYRPERVVRVDSEEVEAEREAMVAWERERERERGAFVDPGRSKSMVSKEEWERDYPGVSLFEFLFMIFIFFLVFWFGLFLDYSWIWEYLHLLLYLCFF